MKNLELIKTENGKEAVLCSVLYNGLGLQTTHFKRWVKKNILNNPFALENTDFSEISYPKGNISNRNIDFVLTLDFAKKLAMQCRTETAERVRNYFLQCEKQAQSKELQLFNELMQELANYRRIEAIRVQRIELNRELRSIKKAMQESEPRQIPPHGIQLSLMFN